MFEDLHYIIPLCVCFFVMNYLVYKYFVSFALSHYIRPFLSSKSLTLVKVEYAGLFNTGDFPEKEFTFFGSTSGNIVNHLYVFVFATTPEKKEVRFTAKIVTVFLTVRKVEFKGL